MMDLKGKFNQKFARAVIKTLTNSLGTASTTQLQETARTLQGSVRSWLSQQPKSNSQSKGKAGKKKKKK
eukprot:COSAG04_NODE_3677_length_2611_cov_1.453025_2_plen_69_part_00